MTKPNIRLKAVYIKNRVMPRPPSWTEKLKFLGISHLVWLLRYSAFMNLWLPHREANITHEKSWYSILSPPPFGIDKSVTIHHFSSRIECDQTLQFAAVCVCAKIVTSFITNQEKSRWNYERDDELMNKVLLDKNSVKVNAFLSTFCVPLI